VATVAATAMANARGAFVVEALTAIAVFSVGVLGNVALQAQAIRHLDDAHNRSEAAHLAQALVGRMWGEDPAGIAARYAQPDGTGYAAFARLARRLPGAHIAGNAAEIRVEPGPGAGSRQVTVVLHWQLPGEAAPHRHSLTAVVGHN
jgi:type IV pilus assembly protein PilV